MANCYGPGVAIGVNADRVDRKFCERIKIVCACVLHREIVGEQKYKVCARQPCLARKKREERERRERKREESSERKERERERPGWSLGHGPSDDHFIFLCENSAPSVHI